mmetsp:Transcript_94107/g.269444  ORF Transcript_94107/g.269444 Transcript_94107/m.269444 type:complete len:113 (-) Transcript_94107:60-398(-)
MAMRHGLPLVPVYVFGNTKIYKRVQLPSAVEALSNMLHVSLVAFWGRLGSLVPFQVPLTYAIGNAIDTGRPNLNPTEAQVDALHALFCAELKRIFDDHKGGYGWGHKELVLV